MRAITMSMAQFKADTKSGESLKFDSCKGGYFSDTEEYGLKVAGNTAQDILEGKNLLNPQIASQNQTIESNLDPDNNTYTLRGKVGTGAHMYNTGQLMFPLSNAETYSTSVIGVKQNTYYTISFEYLLIEQGVYNSTIQFNVLNKSLENEFQSYVVGKVGVTKNVSFNVLTTTTGIGLMFRLNNNYVTISNIQVEKGEVATAYEPYCGGIASPNPEYPQPIQCVKQGTEISVSDENGNVYNTVTTPCDLYEGDIWYPTLGKVRRASYAYEFTGDEAWGKSSYENYLYTFSPVDIRPSSGRNRFIKCNRASKVWEYGSSEMLIYLNDLGLGDITADDFKALLKEWHESGEPMKIVYEVDKHYEETTEAQQLSSPPGNVHVVQLPTKLSADLSATMLVRR